MIFIKESQQSLKFFLHFNPVFNFILIPIASRSFPGWAKYLVVLGEGVGAGEGINWLQ